MSSISDLDRQRMDEITAGLPTKSEKIRRLAAAGFQRADIARYLDIRYQHVRNVLTAPRPKKTNDTRVSGTPTGSANTSGPEAGAGTAPGAGQRWVWTTLGKGGRVEIPTPFLAAMGIAEGDSVQLAIEGDMVRILSRDAVIREVQAYVRHYVPDDVSLVDELLAERRLEAASEAADSHE